MMTKDQKEYKLKLISLIILVETEWFRKTNFDNVFVMMAQSMNFIWWAMEYKKIYSIPTLEIGCALRSGSAIAGESSAEIIITKTGRKFGISPLENKALIDCLRNYDIAKHMTS